MAHRKTNPDSHKYQSISTNKNWIMYVFCSVRFRGEDEVLLKDEVIKKVEFSCVLLMSVQFQMMIPRFRERFCWVGRSRWSVDDSWETPCLQLRFIPPATFPPTKHKYKWKYKYKYKYRFILKETYINTGISLSQI